MFQKSFSGLAAIASSMLVATAQLSPLPASLHPGDLIFPLPLVELQTIDVKIASPLIDQIRLEDQLQQPFGEGECMVPGPDGTNQGLGLGDLDLDFGGFRDFTLPSGNTFDNACCVFYLVTPNTARPDAFVAISNPFQLFKKDPGANFTNACATPPPVSSVSASTSGPTTLATGSSSTAITKPTTSSNVTIGGPPTTTQSYTTSTIYATSVTTITQCPAAVTNCPLDYKTVVTSTIAISTTVCPVAPTHTPPPVTTSTIYATTFVTVTECPATVTNCPAHYSTVLTSVYPVSTTVCVVPVNSLTYTTTVSPIYSSSTVTLGGIVYTSTYEAGYTTYPVLVTTAAPYYPSQTLTKTAAGVVATPTYTTAPLQFTGAAIPAQKKAGGLAAGLGAVMGLFLAL